MDVMGGLIVFSAMGAIVCAKARAAGPTLLFGIVAVMLFCVTPMGSRLPGAFGDAAQWVGSHSGSVVSHGGSR